jgi:hypothetical protein
VTRLQANAPEPDRIPRRLAVALAGLVVEAVVLVGAACWVLVTVVVQGSPHLGVALFLAAFALGVGALLLVGVRALRRSAPRVRGPVVTWQLLQAATAVAVLGVPGRTGAAAGVAVGGLVLATVVVGGVLSRPADGDR